jgi:membrane protein implicated in regulation of membrane protease activity
MDLAGFDWWVWLIVGLILAGAELALPGGLFLIFLGLAAIAVGGLRAAGLLPDLWQQLIAFAAFSVGAMALLRRPIQARLSRPGAGEADVDRLVGASAYTLGEVAADGFGQVELRGSTWTARNATARALAPGERCIVEAVDGLTLIVRAARPGITASPRPGAVHGKAAAPDSITGEHV